MHNGGRERFPSRVKLVYVIKKCQDLCLLNPIWPLLLDQKVNQLHINLEVFVTQETNSDATVRELVSEFSQTQTVNFDTKCSSHAAYGPENSLWLAVIAGISSLLFLVFLTCFNHIFLHPPKMASKAKKPSSVTDLYLICCFILSVVCGTLVSVTLRRKWVKEELPPGAYINLKQGVKHPAEAYRAVEEVDIHCTGRPNFEGIN